MNEPPTRRFVFGTLATEVIGKSLDGRACIEADCQLTPQGVRVNLKHNRIDQRNQALADVTPASIASRHREVSAFFLTN
jgi:hypothetical protein